MATPSKPNIPEPEIVEMDLDEMIPVEWNPRKISDEARDGLKESIKTWGMLQPIVIKKRTRHIVGGHQKYRILQGENVKRQRIFLIDIPEEEERAANLALNNPGIQGEWDQKKLSGILSLVKTDLGEEKFRGLRLTELESDKQEREVRFRGEVEFATELLETNQYVLFALIM